MYKPYTCGYNRSNQFYVKIYEWCYSAMGESTQFYGEFKSHFVMQILWFVTPPFLFIKPGSCTNLVPLLFTCLMVAPVFIYNSNALARIFLIKN